MPGFTKSLLAASAVVALSAGTAQADIVIATAGPMTGQYAIFGEQMQKGAEQAVKDLNAAGGVLGEQLVLQVGDDACDPKQAVAVANQMVNEGVVFIAGHFCSGSSIPASQVYNEEGILQISPASTNPQLTEQGFDNVFRVCGRDDQQGKFAADYVVDNNVGSKIAVRPRQDRLRQGPGRRVQEAAQRARRRGGDVRGDHRGRQGLHRADHQDEAGRHRPDLSRRLPHRGRPDRPPGERAGPGRHR